MARGSQNGIGLFESREAWIADNDVSGNSGWGIHLWKSSRNTIMRNKADHNVRCESPAYRRGCDSAALLLREQSDSNLVAENDLTWSGDGFFLSGQRPHVSPSIGNVVLRNDASHAWHNGFEATFSAWNVFLENRADSTDYGFWLGYSRGNMVRGNVLLGTRTAAIAIEHGGENEIDGQHHHRGSNRDSPVRARARMMNRVPTIGSTTTPWPRSGRGSYWSGPRRVRLRGNLLDGVEDGLVADSAAQDAEVTGNVFLSARRWLIDAVLLDAGGNFWGPRDSAAAQKQVRGRVNLQPFRQARDAGY